MNIREKFKSLDPTHLLGIKERIYFEKKLGEEEVMKIDKQLKAGCLYTTKPSSMGSGHSFIVYDGKIKEEGIEDDFEVLKSTILELES